MLFFSSILGACVLPQIPHLFQSRNRDAFLFKSCPSKPGKFTHSPFQSRNRDAFLFKSTRDVYWHNVVLSMFQSRNRDAFLFKSSAHGFRGVDERPRFNLVIEMLFFSRANTGSIQSNGFIMFQSRNRDAFLFKRRHRACGSDYGCQWFQSRNRDAFLFKFYSLQANETRIIAFQSRNRDAFLFK